MNGYTTDGKCQRITAYLTWNAQKQQTERDGTDLHPIKEYQTQVIPLENSQLRWLIFRFFNEYD